MATAVQFEFDAAQHLYKTKEGLIVPSVTQVLASVGLVSYNGVSREVIEHARERGDVAHEACAFLDQDRLDWESVDGEVLPYVLAWERAKKELGFVADADGIEQPGVATVHGMHFGYTIDRRGRVGKHRTILELKCTAEEEASWKYQLAGYALASDTPALWQLAAVHLRPDASYRLCPYQNHEHYQRIFLAALAITWEKINEGIRWKD